MSELDTVEIPARSLFRSPEVCEIARIQAYVLRSWEAEFPDLGVAKTAGGPRVYRKADVERVLRLKHLLFVEGLTLAGARRKIAEEQPAAPQDDAMAALGELLGDEARQRIQSVGQTLRELAAMLSRRPGEPPSEDEAEFQLRGVAPKGASRTKVEVAEKKPVRKKK